ncbi:PTS sugar transporter subunit IIA [Mucisphaera calidilacus]|uniref:PTS system mannose-specific EIIBCA component n=1 Tax=Mucisphaera calidilacus TaxID=2527982 RepID=A0A518BV44_9BACT|nr:PTS sugar transporter subunit IIA [Mucisphaera calidilacus]QDU70855.1 PTS system mannose-specific EIIBCA component [Mucisphaera calidilacus]
MRLTDILQPDCVIVPLKGGDKHEVIDEMAELLAEKSPIASAEDLKQAIWQREQTRTTGIGHGIGIPHGKASGVDKLRMAVGRPEQPIEFGAIDGRPVDLIILLASPLDQTGPHIQALAKISRMLTEDDLREALKVAPTAEDLYAIIAEHESNTPV